jgi:hypothetical protein
VLYENFWPPFVGGFFCGTLFLKLFHEENSEMAWIATKMEYKAFIHNKKVEISYDQDPDPNPDQIRIRNRNCSTDVYRAQAPSTNLC